MSQAAWNAPDGAGAPASPRRGAPSAPDTPRTPRSVKLLLALGIAIFAAVLVPLHLLMLQQLSLDSWDLAVFCQAIHSAAHGGLLRSSLELHNLVIAGGVEQAARMVETGGISHLGVHWSPILFCLAPIYRLLPDPATLQVIHVLALASGAIPVYLFARGRLGGQWMPLLLALAYLAQPLTIILATETFRETALAAPLLLLLFLGAADRRPRLFLGAAAAALLVKEDLALLVLLFGVGLLIRRRYRDGAIAVGGAAATLAIAALVMSWCRDGVPSDHLLRFQRFGGSAAEIVGGVLSDPGAALSLIWSRLSSNYVLHLLVPWLLLPLLSPYALLAIPVVALNLLSSVGHAHVEMSSANTLLIPILAASAVDGAARLVRLSRRLAPGLALPRRARTARSVVVIALFFAACGGVLHRFAPAIRSAARPRLTAAEQRGALHFMARIPAGSAVMASYSFLPKLSGHARLSMPWDMPGFAPDYLLLSERDRFYWPFSSPRKKDRFITRLIQQGYVGQRVGKVSLFRRPTASQK